MNNQDIHRLGLLIQQHRHERGLSRRDVEKASGITESAQLRLERGEVSKPHALQLTRLAEVFKTEAADYFALAGYLTPDGLPELPQYLHTKYGLSTGEAERIEEIFDALRGKWAAGS